jgi:plasmid stability protein
MANLTITVNDDSLKKARIRAIQEGTSVNALLREYLDSYSNLRRDQQEAVARILMVSRKSKSRRGERTWSRDELHDRN